MPTHFKPGDCVIYRMQKFSAHPGRHARAIYAAPNGDSYSYAVEKCWRVIGVRSDDTVVVCTRRGKRHTLAADDPALRRATWWERLRFRNRFPVFQPADQDHPADAT